MFTSTILFSSFYTFSILFLVQKVLCVCTSWFAFFFFLSHSLLILDLFSDAILIVTNIAHGFNKTNSEWIAHVFHTLTPSDSIVIRIIFLCTIFYLCGCFLHAKFLHINFYCIKRRHFIFFPDERWRAHWQYSDTENRLCAVYINVIESVLSLCSSASTDGAPLQLYNSYDTWLDWLAPWTIFLFHFNLVHSLFSPIIPMNYY